MWFLKPPYYRPKGCAFWCAFLNTKTIKGERKCKKKYCLTKNYVKSLEKKR